MWGVSKKTTLAIEAVVLIAHQSRSSPVSSKELADQLALPLRYLEPVMQRLVHTGILRGVRGPRGGYVLAKERRKITLAEIASAALLPAGEDENEAPFASPIGQELLAPVWSQAAEAALHELSKLTLEKICGLAKKAGLQPSEEEADIYTI